MKRSWLDKLKFYGRVCRAVAAHRQVPAASVLARLAWCRLRFDLGPRDFLLFDLYPKASAQIAQYLLKGDVEPWQQRVNRNALRLADDKLFFYAACRAQGVAVPETVLVLSREPPQAPEPFPRVGDADAFARALSASPHRQLFAKLVDGAYGHGSFKLDQHAGALLLNDSPSTPKDVLRHCEGFGYPGRAYLFQQRLRAHDALAEVTSASGLATVRLLTIHWNGGVEFIAAVFKPTVGDNCTDNFMHGRTRNLAADVDLASGRLGNVYGPLGSDPPLIVRVERHPDSGKPFAGLTLPGWVELKACVERAARAFPELITAGWDVALTDRGPVLLEVNRRYDVDLPQVAGNRGLRPVFERYWRGEG